MISWQSIMSVFNTKGTLLKWLKTLDQSLQDGVLQSVTVNSVSDGVITLSFNFADGSVITTPQIDIPQGAQGPEGPQGVPGVNGTNGESFNPMGEWVTENGYHPFDYVTYAGSSYLCTATIIDGTDAPPIDTAHWQLVAEKGDPGDPGTGPNIPTPTTADNGKVLGVANGEYALQEASGGGGVKLYLHSFDISGMTQYIVTPDSFQYSAETLISAAQNGKIISWGTKYSSSLFAMVAWVLNVGRDPYQINFAYYSQNDGWTSGGVISSRNTISDTVTPL